MRFVKVEVKLDNQTNIKLKMLCIDIGLETNRPFAWLSYQVTMQKMCQFISKKHGKSPEKHVFYLKGQVKTQFNYFSLISTWN